MDPDFGVTFSYITFDSANALHGVDGDDAGDRGAVLSLSAYVPIDTDGDGIADHCDLDSDNDGISDLVESGNADAIAADTDGDGIISADEATAANFTDADGDGVWDQLGATPPVDTDGDGIADYLDLDSDNDGIADAVEAQPTAGYTAPDGSEFFIPVDTDGDGVADFLDTDSDNDGVDDIVESGLPLTGNDDDGDGIDDGVGASYADPDGIVNDPINDLENSTDNDPRDVDYRSVELSDKDWDGVADIFDADQDGDGILDADESALPEFVNGDFSAGGSGWTSTGVNFVNLSGGPNVGDSVARLDANHVTSSLSQTFPAGTSVEEFTFEFGWNNGTSPNRTAGQFIEFQIDGVTYLTIETPDDGGGNADDATQFGGDALFTALNGATFSIANPSGQGSQFLDHSNFNQWTLTPITVTLPASVDAPTFNMIAGPKPGSNIVSDDFAVTNFQVTQGFTDTDGDGIGAVSYTHLTLPTKA